MDHYIHHVSGRLRVQSPVIKKNSHRAEADFQELFGAVLGIRSTEINKSAGCVIIYYDPERITPNDILNALQEAGYLAHPALPQLLLHRAHAATKAGDLFGKAVFNVFVNKALERSIASLTTALF